MVNMIIMYYKTSNSKILVPMEDRKDAKEIKIIAMLNDKLNQKYLKMFKKYLVKQGIYSTRTFAFDRNTDIVQYKLETDSNPL
jgi:hypothetical protein